MTSIIAFAPAFDTHGRHDATGAFQPEARAFLKHNGAEAGLFLISNRNTEDAMRKQVLGVLSDASAAGGDEYPTIAFFCHGLGRKIQFGFDVRNVDQLAAAMKGLKGWALHARVVLYACNTGMASKKEQYEPVGGDGGFADALRDAMCRADLVWARVDAHTTAGHTTRNPYVRRFEGMGSPVGGVGGYMLVAPGTKLWPKWRKALRDTNLRYDVPLMSVSEIHERLVGS